MKKQISIIIISIIMLILVGGATWLLISQFNMKDPSRENQSEQKMHFNFMDYKAEHFDNPDDVGVMIMDCDSSSFYKKLYGALFTQKRGQYVQGTGAMDITLLRAEQMVFGTFDGIDISDYQDGSIHISLYVRDAKYLGDGPLTLELTSSGQFDVDELSWEIFPTKLKSGWNELYLGMEDAVVVGKPDLAKINYFRIFTLTGSMGLDAYLDCVYATDTQGMDLKGPELLATTKQGYLIDFDSLDGIISSGELSLSQSKGMYKEGTAGVAVSNPFDVWVAAKFNPINMTAYKNGKILFWIYINDAAHVKNGTVCVELGSAGTCDEEEVSWTFSGETFKSGWNEVTLGLTSAAQSSEKEIDWTRVNYFRIFGMDCSKELSLIIDAIQLLPVQTRVPKDGMIWDCDALAECTINTPNQISITTAEGEYKQGTGALKGIVSDLVWWSVNTMDLVDVSVYSKGGIHLWLYIDDVSKIDGVFWVELGSGSTYDVDEYEWECSNLRSGWNELNLAFADASVSGMPDLSKINFMRMFGGIKKETIIIMDDVHAIENVPAKDANTEDDPVNSTVDPEVEGMLLSGDSKKYAAISGTSISITREQGEYMQGTGAVKSVGAGQERFVVTLNQAKDISAYKNGGIEFQLYIKDKSVFVSDALFVELTSAGSADDEEMCWIIPIAALENGWNTLLLPFADVSSVAGEIDYTAVDYFRIYTSAGETNENVELILDNVHVVEAVDTVDSKVEGMIFSGDSDKYATIFGAGISITREQGEYMQGTGAVKSVGAGQERFVVTLNQAKDISAYKNGGTEFQLYIKDKSVFVSDALFVELTSAGSADDEETCWIIPIAALENGWNTLLLPFADVSSVAGEIDYTAVDYFRIYTSAGETNENVELILDNVHVVEAVDTVDSKVESMIFSGDSDKYATIFGAGISITREQGEYMQGTGAVKSVGAGQERFVVILNQSKDISAYKNGGIEFQLYIKDKSVFVSDALFVELTSAGSADDEEMCWIIPIATLKNGWNTLSLSFADVSSTAGEIDYTAVDYFRIYTSAGETNENAEIVLDDVHAVLLKEKASVQILSCDNATDVTSGVNVTNTEGQYKEGTGAYITTDDAQVRWQSAFTNSVNIASFDKLHLYLYVSDVSKLGSNVRIEISSSGTCDNEELEWSINPSELQNGWNELYLDFATEITAGIIDLTKVNFFRVYMQSGNTTEAVTMIVDDVRAVKSIQLLDCDVETDVEPRATVTTEAGKVKEGNGAYRVTGSGQDVWSLKFNQSVNASLGKAGKLRFWLYVDSVSKVNGAFVVELNSRGQCDDNNEIQWMVQASSLKDGWNEVVLNLKQPQSQAGEVDFSAINYMRLYHVNGSALGSMTATIDEIDIISY